MLLPLITGLALALCAPYTGPADGAIHACGHAWRLICTLSGSPVPCSGTHAGGPAAVDQFQVLDENGQVALTRGIFEPHTTAEELFTSVQISSMGFPDHELLEIGVESKSRSRSGTYDFLITPAGLEPFRPGVSCGDGQRQQLSNSNLWKPIGMAAACEFNAGYFRFQAVLQYDPDHHQIGIAPGNAAFDTFENRATVPGPSRIRAWSDHNRSASSSLPTLHRGQIVRLTGAWAPLSLETTDPETATLRYDSGNLWLRIEIRGRTLWIHGDHDFRAIGLQGDSRLR